jgi:hypothetical protein
MEARGANGIAKALDAAKANAVTKNDVLIKVQPSVLWVLVWLMNRTTASEAIASGCDCRLAGF